MDPLPSVCGDRPIGEVQPAVRVLKLHVVHGNDNPLLQAVGVAVEIDAGVVLIAVRLKVNVPARDPRRLRQLDPVRTPQDPREALTRRTDTDLVRRETWPR